MAKRKTDEEILFALKRCGTDKYYKSCDQCPYSGNFKNCIDRMTKDAANLIESQQAEIERLKELIDVRHKVFETKCEELETAKPEAIKEFAERLKEKSFYVGGHIDLTVKVDDIDNLVKEMVGDAE